MKDDDGRVLIDGFYDGIELTDADRETFSTPSPTTSTACEASSVSPEPDAAVRLAPGSAPVPVAERARPLERLGGRRGAHHRARPTAVAAIDVRLVDETDADAMYEQARVATFESRGYHIVDEAPDDALARRARAHRPHRFVALGSNAFRTPLDDVESGRVVDALTEMWSEPPIRIRTMGGTVPISPFIRALGFPALAVPTVNFDNNQHSPNENLRLGHLFDSIVSLAAVLAL